MTFEMKLTFVQPLPLPSSCSRTSIISTRRNSVSACASCQASSPPPLPSSVSRRDVLKFLSFSTASVASSSLFALSFPFSSLSESAADTFFELPPLPYAYDALQPRISSDIMHAHHDVHFNGYVTNLNKALSSLQPKLNITDDKSLIKAFQSIDIVNDDTYRALRNNGGGYLNHKLFFSQMAPNPRPLAEKAPLSKAINAKFGSFQKFQDTFLAEAAALFGSGFTWLVRNSNNEVSIMKTANQDHPSMFGMTPILACDCWEHAWYLQYGPKKKDYFKEWWKLVDWPVVNDVFESSSKQGEGGK